MYLPYNRAAPPFVSIDRPKNKLDAKKEREERKVERHFK